MTMKPTAILTAALLCVLSPFAFAKPLKVFIPGIEGENVNMHDVGHGKVIGGIEALEIRSNTTATLTS